MKIDVEVDTRNLNTEMNSIKEELQSIRDNIESMFNAINKLDTMWDGEASEAFRLQFINDKAEIESFCNTVKEIIDNMGFAKSKYDSCESEISSLVKSTKV